MEEIEIHSRSYLLRWVHAKSLQTISWTIQPHKRSINFGLFKHPGALASLPTVAGLPPLTSTASRSIDEPDDNVPEVVDKLASIGLKQIIKLCKYEADRFSTGKYDVPNGEGGHYALVFDNTFSKSTGKNVTFFLLTYPTASRAQISFGAQVQHSHPALSPGTALAPTLVVPKKSPGLGLKDKSSLDSLARVPSETKLPGLLLDHGQSSRIYTGVLAKRRRKKGQGYARRFFCLDFTSSTLSYYHDRHSSALRGAIPLSLAAIGANAKTREISIDSGAEVWHLKARSPEDFAGWRQALERASKLIHEDSDDDKQDLHLDTSFPNSTAVEDDVRWQRAESLLSQIAGTRDAVRRLVIETQHQSSTPSSHQTPTAEGQSPTIQENGGEDYFGKTSRPAFWKRKASQSTVINSKRSTSHQLTVPHISALHNHENGIHEHMKAVQGNLDQVVTAFASLMQDWKRSRSAAPDSAVSRMSVESQEYFDAEDIKALSRSDTQFLDIEESASSGEEDASGSDSDMDEHRPGNRIRSGSLSAAMPTQAKSLAPLPTDPVARRSEVRAPTVAPPSLVKFLRDNAGKDLSTISMPVSANEPISLLQKAAENLEYSELLDTASRLKSIEDRLLHVAAFAISPLSGARVKARSMRKPFNPMLGETYELVREDKNYRFVSEKVSHRPVQLAFHAESKRWSLTQSPKPSQKFWGKSSEIITKGKIDLVLYEVGECYSWHPPTCYLRNVIAGEKYIEPTGSMDIVCDTTGHRATVTFKSKGMFGGRSEEIDVKLYDDAGHVLSQSLHGTWTKSLSDSSDQEIWQVGPLIDKADSRYGMTLFAVGLNEITSLETGKLPVTDSRLRGDQRALEDGHYDEAEKLKNEIEEGQRRRRREMEEAGTPWLPKWFVQVNTDEGVAWKLKRGKDDYWERRARGDWTGVVDVLDPGA